MINIKFSFWGTQKTLLMRLNGSTNLKEADKCNALFYGEMTPFAFVVLIFIAQCCGRLKFLFLNTKLCS